MIFDILEQVAGVTQLVERQPSKLKVEGSSPFARSNHFFENRFIIFYLYARMFSGLMALMQE